MNRVGSSLPNCSGTPVALKRSVRDFDRSIASEIISGVAVRGTFLAVDVDVDDDVEVVCADVGRTAMANVAATVAAATVARFRGTYARCIVFLLEILPLVGFPDQPTSRGSPSGRISGFVKTTPSGVGFGVGVTPTCGEPGTPVRSWSRISMAKSSCTVLWQWLT